MSDRSKPPEGYDLDSYLGGEDGSPGERWRPQMSNVGGSEFTDPLEAIAACWAHADRQRAIGYEQGRAEGDISVERNWAVIRDLRAQLATAKADGAREALNELDQLQDGGGGVETEEEREGVLKSMAAIRAMLEDNAATTPKEGDTVRAMKEDFSRASAMAGRPETPSGRCGFCNALPGMRHEWDCRTRKEGSTDAS